MKKILLVMLVLVFVMAVSVANAWEVESHASSEVIVKAPDETVDYLQFHNKLFLDVNFGEIFTITPEIGLRLYCDEVPELYSLYYGIQGELTLDAFYFRLEHRGHDEAVGTVMFTIGVGF